jgi:hypothetical protein
MLCVLIKTITEKQSSFPSYDTTELLASGTQKTEIFKQLLRAIRTIINIEQGENSEISLILRRKFSRLFSNLNFEYCTECLVTPCMRLLLIMAVVTDSSDGSPFMEHIMEVSLKVLKFALQRGRFLSSTLLPIY